MLSRLKLSCVIAVWMFGISIALTCSKKVNVSRNNTAVSEEAPEEENDKDSEQGKQSQSQNPTLLNAKFESGKVKISWTGDLNTIRTYTLLVAKDNACKQIVIKLDDIKSTEYTLTIVEPGSYFICISDQDKSGKEFPAKNNGLKVSVPSVGNANIEADRLFISDPQDSIAGTAVEIKVLAQDANGNIDVDVNESATLVCTGSATGCGMFNIVAGQGTISINDTKAETVNLSLQYSGSVSLDSSSTQTVAFNPGAASKFVILDPTDTNVGTAATVTVQAQDDHGNKVTTYNTDVTLICSGSASGCGLVDIVYGEGSKQVSNSVTETVNLSLSNSQSTTLDFSSTQDLVFNAVLDFVDDANDTPYGFAAGLHNNTAWQTDATSLKTWSASEKEFQFDDNNQLLTEANFDTNNLVGYWRLNGSPGPLTTGMTFSDYSTKGHTATVQNADVNGFNQGIGKLNEGIIFDSNSDDYLLVADHSDFSFDRDGAYSWAFWVKPSDLSIDFSTLWEQYAGANDSLRISLGTTADDSRGPVTNGVMVEIYTTDAGNTTHSANNVLTQTDFHHVLVTYDGSIPTFYKRVRIYIDGVDQRDGDLGWLGGNFSNFNPSTTKIGGDITGNNFYGTIDEVSFWHRTLSSAEVRKLYNRQNGDYGGGTQGIYTSRIIDSANTNTSWKEISWIPKTPYGKELPTNAISESAYSTGNMDTNLLQDLWGYWRLNGSGNLNDNDLITDFSGNNHPLTVEAGGTQNLSYVTGRFNQGIHFLEAADHLMTNPHADLDLSSDFSLMAWFKVSDPCTNWCNIAYGQNTSNQEQLYLEIGPGGFVDVYLKNRGGNWVLVNGPPVNDGQWHHVIIVREVPNLKLYLDGSLVGSGTLAGSTIDFSDYGLSIAGSGEAMIGTIDEVAFWRKALSDENVKLLFRRGAQQLRFQVTACAQADCSDADFLGPDGTSASYFSEEQNSSIGLPNLTISPPLVGRYFRYKAFFDFDDYLALPELKSFEVTPD